MNCKLSHSPAGNAPTGKFSKCKISVHIRSLRKTARFSDTTSGPRFFETEIQKSNQGNIRNRISNCPLCSLVVMYMILTHLSFKMESTRKLSNFNFQWPKTLYQNNLKHIAFKFTFMKG